MKTCFACMLSTLISIHHKNHHDTSKTASYPNKLNKQNIHMFLSLLTKLTTATHQHKHLFKHTKNHSHSKYH